MSGMRATRPSPETAISSGVLSSSFELMDRVAANSASSSPVGVKVTLKSSEDSPDMVTSFTSPPLY